MYYTHAACVGEVCVSAAWRGIGQYSVKLGSRFIIGDVAAAVIRGCTDSLRYRDV